MKRKGFSSKPSPLLTLFLALLLAACVAAPAPPALPGKTLVPLPGALSLTTPIPTLDPLYRSNGGGEPRGAGYWMVWNTCAENNQSAAAKANGGRAAGWLLLDDLLADPGILVGQQIVTTCAQALAILQGSPPGGAEQATLPFYKLAAGLLAAQLNLAVPAETCPAVEQAVVSGQLLLISAGYAGNANPVTPKDPQKDAALAEFLVGQLDQYNAGQLCQ